MPQKKRLFFSGISSLLLVEIHSSLNETKCKHNFWTKSGRQIKKQVSSLYWFRFLHEWHHSINALGWPYRDETNLEPERRRQIDWSRRPIFNTPMSSSHSVVCWSPGKPAPTNIVVFFSIFQKTHRDKNIQKKAYIIYGKYGTQPKIMNMDLEFGCNIGWCRLP